VEIKDQERREKRANMSRHGKLMKSFSKSPDPKELQIQTSIGFGNLKTSGIGTATSTAKSHVRFKLDATPLKRSSQGGL